MNDFPPIVVNRLVCTPKSLVDEKVKKNQKIITLIW